MNVVPANTAWWEVDLLTATALLLVTVGYLWALSRAVRMGYPLGAPGLRAASFLVGIALLGFAYLGPPGAWAHMAFWPHMTQHVIVMMISAPLIVLASPVRVVFANLGRAGRVRMMGILRSRAAGVLTNAWLTWLLYAGVLIGIHVTPVMEGLLGSHGAMRFAERPIVLAVSLLFYYPLIGCDLIARRPLPSTRLVSLGAMMVPETVLGMVIHLSPVVLYPSYEAMASRYGLDALADQKFAGAIMWAVGMVLDGIWLMVAALEWWRDQERATARLEAAEASSSGSQMT